MAPSSSSSAATTSVQVALRIRPATSQDSSIPARFQRSVIHASTPTSVSVDNAAGPATGGPAPAASAASATAAGKKQVFSFDRVHGPPTTQHEMFTANAQPLISRFVEGFNCTILAYGQTSSGKTHTMTGYDLDADPSDPNNGMGIIPRAVSTIFSTAKQLRDDRQGAWSFQIKSSFIEIYNEDLIDLLVDDTGGARREVQIREDKEGHIIWGGLRELVVKNPSEVMTLLRKGSAIRRTNETDMNAQSSRSHAIFSLTLTQKKFVGSGAPPRSSSPLPGNGRSPSRLARPGSVYGGGAPATRVASPTGGRPSTPSFASAMGRGGGLRPSSALGHTTDNRGSLDEDGGEWLTIVSKFHFVDLAGSERLKRTAAAGERVKEGISINSGLLALGNVISALGDPARAKAHMSHVPYRDSKLTRLLQDSLGGNAHTLMIACVSAAEWNVGETVNTLKYANRARNIKNSAVVNAREEGWEDVEWLQGTVKRLRAEVKGLKEGGAIPAGAPEREAAPLEGAGKKVLAQMTELQNNYEDLREKFVERTEELTRLRRDLGERTRGSGGASGGTGKYEEIVGPVIEEYEKTIAAMEAELNLNRVALRHTNEMVEEKEDELAIVTERHAATELYVEELRARVAKLTEREASTEAYVRDLEEKMKTYDESSITSSESLTDLKREVGRFRDAESHSAKYIADLEARLARTDESVLTLQQTVEQLEGECERRRGEVTQLQARLETLQTDGDGWRSDLEERERRLKELEEEMKEWERKKTEASETRTRLGSVVGEVAEARKSLQLDLGKQRVNGAGSGSATPSDVETPLASVAVVPDAADRHPDADVPDDKAQSQLLALQQTHTATLADLSSVTAKYRDALREISDLAAQIQEAKLAGAEPHGSTTRSDSPTQETPVERPVDAPPFRRRMTGGRSRESSGGEPQYNSAGRRLFFRQAASAESLHGRQRSLSQSQSLSQELSSVHSRKTSFSTSASGSPASSPFLSPHHPGLGRRPSLSILLPNSTVPSGPDTRSVSSLEKEIMRLQEVLKEREAEIALLEGAVRESKSSAPETITSAPMQNGHTMSFPPPKDPATPPNGVDESANPVHLSPKTISQFDNIRRSMSHEPPHGPSTDTDGSEVTGSSVVSDQDESLERLNELMLSMAQKESSHREIVEDLKGQLSQVRRQHDDLTALSRDQAANMSMEIEALQRKHGDVIGELEDAKVRENVLAETLERTVAEHALELEQLQIQLDEALKTHEDAKAQHESALSKVAAEHTETLKQKEAQALASLQTTEEEYYNALTKLRADHAAALETHASEAAAALERLREEHIAETRMADLAREGSLTESLSSKDLALQGLQDAHAEAVARKEASFAEQLKDLRMDHSRALTTKDEDYALEMDKLRSAHEGSLAKLKEEWRVEHDAALQGLQHTHTEALALKEASLAQELTDLKAEHATALTAKDEEYALEMEKMRATHEGLLAKLKDELLGEHEASLEAAVSKAEEELVENHMQETMLLKSQHQETIAEINNSLVGLHAQHREAMEATNARHAQTLEDEHTKLTATLHDLKLQHSKELETLHKDRDLLAQELESHKAATDEFTIVRAQTQQVHEQAIGEKTALLQNMEQQLSTANTERDTFEAEVNKLRAELDRTRSEQSKLIQEASKRESLVGDLERHRSVLADMQENLQRVKDEKDTLQTEKNRSDTLVRELQAQVLARSSSPPNGRPGPDRNLAYTRATGLPAMKLPPPTPPPSVPPPPAPRANGDSTSSHTSSAITSSSSRDSQLDSPSTSVGPSSVNGSALIDPKTTARLEQQAKQLDEQETMIKTLNKQLTHCESDLQTHMDLVSTLETSLGDSEKNLRKARMHATELARERDSLNVKIETLRGELEESKREVVSVRNSVVQEKQSLEQRLDEERKAKERARQQLDVRMDELQKRKSKFACL